MANTAKQRMQKMLKQAKAEKNEMQVNFRIDRTIDAKIGAFAEKTKLSKKEIYKQAILEGFEALENEYKKLSEDDKDGL
jgi:predicted transcriptional regulator